MKDDNALDKVVDRTKEMIGKEKFEDTKILLDTDDKFLDHITLIMLWY